MTQQTQPQTVEEINARITEIAAQSKGGLTQDERKQLNEERAKLEQQLIEAKKGGSQKGM